MCVYMARLKSRSATYGHAQLPLFTVADSRFTSRFTYMCVYMARLKSRSATYGHAQSPLFTVADSRSHSPRANIQMTGGRWRSATCKACFRSISSPPFLVLAFCIDSYVQWVTVSNGNCK